MMMSFDFGRHFDGLSPDLVCIWVLLVDHLHAHQSPLHKAMWVPSCTAKKTANLLNAVRKEDKPAKHHQLSHHSLLAIPL